DWNALPPRVPSRVRWLLERCLTKDPRQRLRDIGDARLELHQVLTVGISGSLAAAEGSGAVKTWRRGLPWWSVVAVAVVAVGTTLLAQGKTRPRPSLNSPRFEIYAPKPMVSSFDAAENAISPDGRTLAMVVTDSTGTTRLWVRPIDSFKGRELPG